MKVTDLIIKNMVKVNLHGKMENVIKVKDINIFAYYVQWFDYFDKLIYYLFIKKNKFHIGEYKNDMRDGFGALEFPDGRKYIG